jgi:hypothetical protein
MVGGCLALQNPKNQDIFENRRQRVRSLRITNNQIININTMKLRYIFILLVVFISCTSPKKNNEEIGNRVLYDFEILYRYQLEDNNSNDLREKLSPDSLYFLIESYFQNDYIEISSVQKDIFKGEVNTESSSGVAHWLSIGNIEDINNLSIEINSGPIINFELVKKENNLIGIRKEENKISIVFYKKAPTFY